VSHRCGQTTKIDSHGFKTLLRRRTLQIADVPTITGREKGYAHFGFWFLVFGFP
jgi:hypothetical protein